MEAIKGLPDDIARAIAGKPYTRDTIGRSGSDILLFDDSVLKCESASAVAENEFRMLTWLDGRLPAPRVLARTVLNGRSYLWTSRLPGEMACAKRGMQHMEDTVAGLAEALRMLWRVDVSGCPAGDNVAEALRRGRARVDRHEIDENDFAGPDVCPGGFQSAEALCRYLETHRPEAEQVLSHGDFCLPNVFLRGRQVTGYLDWGGGGVADRWQDIALCVRSLRYNFVVCSGQDARLYPRWRQAFFDALGMVPDEERIQYYCLIDELL